MIYLYLDMNNWAERISFFFLTTKLDLKDKTGGFLQSILLIVNKAHENIKTNNVLVHLSVPLVPSQDL